MFGEQTSCSSRSGYSSGSVPFSGVCSHLGGPLSRSSDVICGKPGACVVAFDKHAGLIEPDYQFGERRIVFAPLAFANRQVFSRNNEELICASMAGKAEIRKR